MIDLQRTVIIIHSVNSKFNKCLQVQVLTINHLQITQLVRLMVKPKSKLRLLKIKLEEEL